MSDIANLQEAVETARAAYARASEQHERARNHALSMIHIVEEQLRDKRIELSQIDVQRECMTQEYGQLRRMLHALVMTAEVDAAGTPENDPTAIEARPNGGTTLAPVAEAARDPKSWRKAAQGGAAKPGTGAEELRAGLKRMLKKKRIPAELETLQADATEAPAPAE